MKYQRLETNKIDSFYTPVEETTWYNVIRAPRG